MTYYFGFSKFYLMNYLNKLIRDHGFSWEEEQQIYTNRHEYYCKTFSSITFSHTQVWKMKLWIEVIKTRARNINKLLFSLFGIIQRMRTLKESVNNGCYKTMDTYTIFETVCEVKKWTCTRIRRKTSVVLFISKIFTHSFDLYYSW